LVVVYKMTNNAYYVIWVGLRFFWELWLHTNSHIF
jgi:hypothetical protein